MEETANSSPEPRVIHFPHDRSLGKFFVDDDVRRPGVANFGNNMPWAEARGKVTIFPGRDLNFSASDTFTDVDMLYLQAFPNLKDFYMRGNVTDAGLAYLSSPPLIDYLSLDGTRVTDAGLRYVPRLAGLRSLSLDDLQGRGITGEGLCDLAPLDGMLKIISLRGARLATDGLASLNVLPNLARLYLDRANMDDRHLSHMPSLGQLTAIHLNSTHVADVGLAHLATLTRLMSIELDHTLVTDAGFQPLAALTGLIVLSLKGTEITDAALKVLCGCHRLGRAHLDGTQVTGAGIVPFINLRHLTLSNCPVTDDDLACFETLTALRVLDLSGTRVTDAGLRHLWHLNQLHLLTLKDTVVTADGIIALLERFPRRAQTSTKGRRFDNGLRVIGPDSSYFL